MPKTGHLFGIRNTFHGKSQKTRSPHLRHRLDITAISPSSRPSRPISTGIRRHDICHGFGVMNSTGDLRGATR
jgi:hypothetical protein